MVDDLLALNGRSLGFRRRSAFCGCEFLSRLNRRACVREHEQRACVRMPQWPLFSALSPVLLSPSSHPIISPTLIQVYEENPQFSTFCALFLPFSEPSSLLHYKI